MRMALVLLCEMEAAEATILGGFSLLPETGFQSPICARVSRSCQEALQGTLRRLKHHPAR
jgi:hypothetical protein